MEFWILVRQPKENSGTHRCFSSITGIIQRKFKALFLYTEHVVLMAVFNIDYKQGLHLFHIPYMFVFITCDKGQKLVVPSVFTAFQFCMYSYVNLLIRLIFIEDKLVSNTKISLIFNQSFVVKTIPQSKVL